MLCPKGVHKGPQASIGAAEVHRHKFSDLHERHVTDGQLKATDLRADLHSFVSPGKPQICHQQQKICANSLPANGVSQDDSGLTVHGTKTLRRKDQEDQSRGMTPSDQPEHPSPITSSIPGQAKCNQPSTTDGTTVLPLTPDIHEAIPGSQLPRLPITSQTVPSGSGRPTMVGTTPHLLKWEKLISPASIIAIDLDTSLQGWGITCKGKST